VVETKIGVKGFQPRDLQLPEGLQAYSIAIGPQKVSVIYLLLTSFINNRSS